MAKKGNFAGNIKFDAAHKVFICFTSISGGYFYTNSKNRNFTIDMDLELICVEDTKGKDVTSKYRNKSEQKFDDETQSQLDKMEENMNKMMQTINQIQHTLTSIQLQINEEQKVNGDGDNGGLQKQIKEINENVKKILKNGVVSGGVGKMEDDSEKGRFRTWVENVLKLPEYYELFTENGVETYDVIKMFTIKELEMVGITKIGHKMKIMNEIQKLQQSQPQEGGTQYL